MPLTNPIIHRPSTIRGVVPCYEVGYLLSFDEGDYALSLYTLNEEEAYDCQCGLLEERRIDNPELDDELDALQEAWGSYSFALDSVNEFFKSPTANVYDYKVEAV